MKFKAIVEKLLGGADSPTGDRPEAAGRTAEKPSVPSGTRVYCIGDIHGRLDLLSDLHRKIEADANEFRGRRLLVYLGDYIDRGEQSDQVIECLLEAGLDGFDSVCLLGNHEQAMLDFLQHPDQAAAWLEFGGKQTLISYGVSPGPGVALDDFRELQVQLEQRLPDLHLTFLKACRLYHLEGDYCFVHAGVRPGVPLRAQRKHDLLWIRDEFTRSRADHGHVVVHGHSITPEVEMKPNRIGIDTGAFHTGVLTCLVLEGDQRRLIQTAA